MKITDCECEAPGWCERHQCHKTLTQVRACRRLPGLFGLWEKGRGPGQSRAQPWRHVVTQPCTYRGGVLRTAECPTCQGRVEVKVFACELHSECTVVKSIDSTACCRACSDYVGSGETV